MVHVWIAPHECGPFAALEGHGAGQAAAADGTRTDQCAHDDGHSHAGEAQAAAQPSADGADGSPRSGTRPVRSAAADRLVGHARGRLPSSRRSPRTSCRRRSATSRSGQTRPSPKRPDSAASATQRRATSTTSSGTGSTTTSPSIPTIPRASCIASNPTVHARWHRRCSCSPRRQRWATSPTGVAR